MNSRSFDLLTRHAASRLSRRASLLALGTSGLAIVAGAVGSDARKRSGKRAKDPCQAQERQCLAVFENACAGDADCLATARRCCAFMRRCDPVGWFTCQVDS